jgi:dihydrodipicolinate synthase/N-acetylneuraminate lyase
MITPFTQRGELDMEAVRRVIDFLIEGGVDGIFVGGTTGEASSMPLAMRHELANITSSHVNHRVRVYAGTGDNCVTESVEAANEYFRLGIDAVVTRPASYYSLSPEELFDYYTLLARDIRGDQLIYNIPVTTHMSIPVDVIVRLSDHPRIVGMKDSENNVDRLKEVVRRLKGRSDFCLLMGASVLSAKALMLGMVGAVPSSANLLPHRWRDLFLSATNHDSERAERLQSEANRVASLLQNGRSLGQSLAAIKAAMSVKGLCEPTVLPPLRTLNRPQIEELRQQMGLLGLS